MANPTTPPSIVDILSDAYAALNRAPWVLLVPLIINAYLWFGPGVSLAPLVAKTSAMVRELQPDGASTADIKDVRDQSLLILDEIAKQDMRGQLAWLNVVPYSIYTFRTAGASADALGLPYIVALSVPIGANNAFQIADAVALFGWIAVINMVTVIASGVFLELARGGVTRMPEWRQAPYRSVRTVAVLLLYALLMAAVMLLLLIPLTIFVMLLFGVSPAFGAFVVFIGAGVWLWVGIYIGFTREVMVLAQIGPIRAIKTSVQIVRSSFWRTLTLMMIVLVIAAGSGVIFTGLIDSFIGRIAVVAISTYLMTGLVMARLRFVLFQLSQHAPVVRTSGV
ncbi:MAG: hypothetical protein NT020_12290 [Chloroflexales bacterium]|nr:hypothetical protein [Chloroflexales bacterium]